MSKDPKDDIFGAWKTGKLGDYAHIKTRIGWRGLQALEYTLNGPYLIAASHIKGTRIVWEKCDRISESRYEESPEIQLHLKDIIISKDGTIGRVGYIDHLPDKATINGTMMLLRIHKSQILPKFIYYYLQGSYFQKLVQEKISGSSVPHIFQRDMQHLPIPLPSLQEQQRIIAILEAADNAIDDIMSVIEKLKLLQKGLLQKIFSQGIGHQQYKTCLWGSIPEKWEITVLQNVAEVIDCKHRTPKYTPQGFSVVRPRDVQPGYLDLSGCLRTSRQEWLDLTEKHRPQPGDIVYSRNASFGVAAFVETATPFSIGQDVCIIVAKKLLGKVLFYLLNSFVIQQQLQRLSSGSTFQRVNLQDIRNFKIPMIPVSEQQQILPIIEAGEQQIQEQQRKLCKFCDIKKFLLQDLIL